MSGIVLSALQRRAAEAPERTALACGGTVVTYGDLATRVRSAGARLAGLAAERVGLAVADPIAFAAVDLASLGASTSLVPIPLFFSPEQIRHVAADSGYRHVICDAPAEPLVRAAGCEAVALQSLERASCEEAGAATDGTRVIYTSGTTGAPKGVIHGLPQLESALHGLAAVVDPSADDRHASLLPQAMLLEQVAGLHLPILAGASLHFDPRAAAALGRGDPVPTLDFLDACAPTTTILVPRQLAALVAAYDASGRRPPASLRMVAVGGAPLDAALLDRARSFGLPVVAGYGLSECCSVVALGRPGTTPAGSVGRPLPGTRVRIDDGEIVVTGASVMRGYVGGAACAGEWRTGEWRTGDLGHLDGDGNLFVRGRCDDILVTAAGRNIEPDWVEATLSPVPGVVRLAATLDGGGGLCCVLETDADPGRVRDALSDAASALPAYARPLNWTVVAPGALAAADLIDHAGKLRRAALRNWYRIRGEARRSAERVPMPTFYERLVEATRPEREHFLATGILQTALERGVTADLYAAYLAQAYHHVRYTCPLLALAASRCGPADRALEEALYAYIAEERGHDAWILDDLRAIGGPASVQHLPQPNWANRAMVGYVHYAVEHGSPYAMLGMVHVLEGISTDIASLAAHRIRAALGLDAETPGFSYLTSHGAIDQHHVAFFRDLVDGLNDPDAEDAIVETARVVYRLWRQMFEAVAAEAAEARRAA